MKKASIMFLPVLMLAACCHEPTLYPRIIVDTYPPNTGPGSVDTFVTLFGPTGDPTLDASPDLWNDDNAPYTVDAPPVSIAEDDDGNPIHPGYARVDYAGGLAAGTYYLRVRTPASTAVGGPYAIRILLVPDDDYASWWYGSYNTTDTPYETDDAPTSGGEPSEPVPIAIGERVNRYLDAGDVDWFVLVLP